MREVVEYLEDRGVEHLVHFTPITNLGVSKNAVFSLGMRLTASQILYLRHWMKYGSMSVQTCHVSRSRSRIS